MTTVRGIRAQRIEAVVPLRQAISCHTARGYLKTRAKERHASTLAAFDKLGKRDAAEGTPLPERPAGVPVRP